MKFFSPSILLTVLGAPLLASAQNANPITLPVGFSATAGSSLNITWTPTTQGTITLVLRSGASNDLNSGAIIASGIENSGSYEWQLPSSITRGSDYTIETVSDSDPSQTNYSHYFVIESTNTVASSTGSSSYFSSVTFGASSTGSASATSTTASSSGSVTLLTGTHTTSGTSSSATGTSSTHTSSTASTTSSSPSSSPSVISQGAAAGGPRATVMAGMLGMLGMIALGAFAL